MVGNPGAVEHDEREEREPAHVKLVGGQAKPVAALTESCRRRHVL